MYIKSLEKIIFKEKIRKTKWLLQLAQELWLMDRPYSCKSILDGIYHFWPDYSSFTFNPGNNKTYKRTSKETIFHILNEIPEKVSNEINIIRQNDLNISMQNAFHCEVETNISILLYKNSPGFIKYNDNFLVNLAIPFEFIKQDSGLQSYYGKDFESFAVYILSQALPPVNISNIPPVSSVWVDLNASFYLGIKLGAQNIFNLMNSHELFSVLGCERNFIDFSEASNEKFSINHGRNQTQIYNELQNCLIELESAIDYEIPWDILKLELKHFTDALETSHKVAHGMTLAKEICKSRKEEKIADDWNKEEYSRKWNAETRRNIHRLDQAMQILEPAARKAVVEAKRILDRPRPGLDIFLSENNPPEIGDLTLWTKDIGKLSGAFMALPLISIKYASAGLLCSGHDWSEAPEIIENMEYLTHVVVHDSDLPWGELGNVDYITLRIDFTRQLYKALR